VCCSALAPPHQTIETLTASRLRQHTETQPSINVKPRLFLTILWTICSATAYAEKPFPAEVTSGGELATEQTATSKLPEALQKLLLKQEVFSDESGKVLSELFTGEFDLAGDGNPEILVDDPASYTGGTMTYIFEKKGDAFSVLGAFQGIQYLAAPVNGYPQIITFSRAGGNVYVRQLYTFKNGEYQSARGAEYELGDGDKEKYLREVEN